MSDVNRQKQSAVVISFRLESGSFERLFDQASKQNLSVHEAAKQIVVEKICKSNALSESELRFDRLEEMIKTVGIDLAFGIERILFGIEDSDEDVMDWINRNQKSLAWHKKG